VVAASVVASAKDLVIERATIHQIEDGPPVEPGYEFLPGETVYLSFRVSGFESKEKDKDEEVRLVLLTYSIAGLDPAGVTPFAPVAGESKNDVHQEDKDWIPKIRRELVLPDHAERGRYKLTIRVKDQVSGAEAVREVFFQVRNKQVAPSEELVFRNFGFYRTENDRRAMTEAVFRTGDAVFVRFDATGYKLAEPKNSFEVEYGLQVTGPDGKNVIEQPVAAAEKFESFYPRRWLPVSFRLDLPKDPAKGVYTLKVQLRDKAADKSVEMLREFTVE
jgi:hypothetical protein